MRVRTQPVALALASNSQRVEQAMREGLTGFEATVGWRAEEIAGRLEEKSNALASQLDGKLSAIEQTIVVHGPELDERLAKRNAEAAGHDGCLEYFAGKKKKGVSQPRQAGHTAFEVSGRVHARISRGGRHVWRSARGVSRSGA